MMELSGRAVSGRSLRLAFAAPLVLVVVADLAFVAGDGGDNWASIGVLLTLLTGSVMLGAVVGFLFGVPRFVAGQADSRGVRRYEPSTTLEQISDWFTKILIGVGLAEAGRITNSVDAFLNDRIVPGLGTVAGAYSVALATVITSGVSGFFGAWLLTRLLLPGALRSADAEVLTDAAANVQNPMLREELLDLAGETKDPGVGDDGFAEDALQYASAVLQALAEIAPSVDGQFKAEVGPWDALLTRGHSRIGVEIKFTYRDHVGTSTIRNLVGRVMTASRRNKPQWILLVTNRPISAYSERELGRLEAQGYVIRVVEWNEGDGLEELRQVVRSFFDRSPDR